MNGTQQLPALMLTHLMEIIQNISNSFNKIIKNKDFQHRISHSIPAQTCDFCTDRKGKIVDVEVYEATVVDRVSRLLLWRVCVDTIFLFQKFQLFLLLLCIHLLESLQSRDEKTEKRDKDQSLYSENRVFVRHLLKHI